MFVERNLYVKKGLCYQYLARVGFENCNHVHIQMIEGLKLEFSMHACKKGKLNALQKNHK